MITKSTETTGQQNDSAVQTV